MTNLITTVAQNGAIYIKAETADHLLKANAIYLNGVFTYGVYITINHDQNVKVLDHPIFIREDKGFLETCLKQFAIKVRDSSVKIVDNKYHVSWNDIDDAIVYKATLNLEMEKEKFPIDINYRDSILSMNCETHRLKDEIRLMYHVDRSTIKTFTWEDAATTTKFYRKGLI